MCECSSLSSSVSPFSLHVHNFGTWSKHGETQFLLSGPSHKYTWTCGQYAHGARTPHTHTHTRTHKHVDTASECGHAVRLLYAHCTHAYTHNTLRLSHTHSHTHK